MSKNIQFTKAVAYARFSSHLQREESIEAQLRAIHDYAHKNNILIVGEYIDRAKSATTDQRPEFLNMVKDATEGQFDMVIVHKLDRFSRDRYDSAHYRYQLRRSGVSIRSVVENLDDSPESVIMESVLEGMAEYYSKNLAREVQKGLKENAYKGLHTGGIPALGYDVNPKTKHLEINPIEAESVRIIYQRFLDGYGYSEIIDELNLKGYKTKRGGVFSKNSLNSILANEKYTGVYIYNKAAAKDIDGKRNGHRCKSEDEIIRVEGAVPRIISNEDFKAVQAKMSRRKHDRKHSHSIETYLLRGKVYCGICGGAYIGSRRVRGDKSVWVAYGCNKRYRNHSANCHNKEISRDYLEQSVLNKLAEYVFDDKCIPKITKEYNQYLKAKNKSNPSREYQSKLKEVNKTIDSIVDLLVQTQSQALIEKLNGLENEKRELEGRIKAIAEESKIQSVSEEELAGVFKKIREQLRSGNLQNIKRVVDTYISKITVYPNEVVVQFNFFPSINIELNNKEDCPSNKGQSSLFNSNRKTVDSGGEGNRQNRTLSKRYLVLLPIVKQKTLIE